MNNVNGLVRKRHDGAGSTVRPRKITIRTTERVSNRFASIQGLIFHYNKDKTIADLFEEVMMPALEAYVRPYVELARMERRVV